MPVQMVDGLMSAEAAATLGGGFSGKVNVGWSVNGFTASLGVATLLGVGGELVQECLPVEREQLAGRLYGRRGGLLEPLGVVGCCVFPWSCGVLPHVVVHLIYQDSYAPARGRAEFSTRPV